MIYTNIEDLITGDFFARRMMFYLDEGTIFVAFIPGGSIKAISSL